MSFKIFCNTCSLVERTRLCVGGGYANWKWAGAYFQAIMSLNNILDEPLQRSSFIHSLVSIPGGQLYLLSTVPYSAPFSSTDNATWYKSPATSCNIKQSCHVVRRIRKTIVTYNLPLYPNVIYFKLLLCRCHNNKYVIFFKPWCRFENLTCYS